MTNQHQHLLDEVLPDATVRQGEDGAIVIHDAAAASLATSEVGEGDLALTRKQARAFARLVRGESLFDGDREDPHVTAIDLGTVWVLPHEQTAEQVQFVRPNLDEFVFETEDKSTACQLTADQAQALYEFLTDNGVVGTDTPARRPGSERGG